MMKEAAAVRRVTFESLLVQDGGVVLWRLRQAEKLTAETKEREKGGRQPCYSFNVQKDGLVFPPLGDQESQRSVEVGVGPAPLYCLQGEAPNWGIALVTHCSIHGGTQQRWTHPNRVS